MKLLQRIKERKEEKRILDLQHAPAFIAFDLNRLINQLYDSFNAFPEYQPEREKLYSLLNEALLEAERLADKGGVHFDGV